MLVLALDTAADRAAVALTDFNAIRLTAVETMSRGHAERLIPMIDDLLRQAGRSLADVDRIAVTVGPGSFTGIRIALSVAKGFAIATGCPVIGIGNLAALAASTDILADGPVLAVIDARRDEFFAAVYSPTGDELISPFAGDANSVLDRASGGAALMIGSGAGILAEAAIAKGQTALPVSAVRHVDPLAIARLAATRDPDASAATPLYIRPPDARPQSSAFAPLAGSETGQGVSTIGGESP